MKKYFSYLGIIAAAAMTLVSCAKEADNFTAEEPLKDGGEFSIVANPATKTVATPTASGATIAWDDDDTMNLYHAETGSSTYTVDGEFTIDSANPASGNFTGTVSGTLSESKTYDWYAFYPYVSAKNSPASTTKGYTPVGSKTNTTQTQTGSDSKAHLSGDDYPLYGKVTGVAYNETPVFEMHHLCSYLEVVVTNSATDELLVNEVTFTAPEDIIGTFYISFADPSNIQYVSSGASYTSDTAVLSVTGSTIPVGGSAKFYIGIKPFTAAAGADFKVSVNGYEKTIHTAKANTFQAGKIKTVNFDYDYTGPVTKSFVWNLNQNQTITATEDELGWVYRGVTMVANKAGASTPTNNYYGGDANNRTSTRFYKNSTLTITPYTGSTITSVVFTATSTDYATALKNSSWTNASAAVDGTVVTVTPTDGTKAISATIGATCGFTKVQVYYTGELATIVNYDVVVVDAPNGTITASEDSAEAGTVITLTATPDSGYKFGSWSVTDDADNPITVINNKFTMPASDVLVTATFNAIVYYDIVVDDSTANGSISASLDTAEEGTVVTLTATPDSGYKLDSWTVTDNADNPVTVTDNKFTMPASDVLVTATFVVDSGETTGTITFGSSAVKISAASVTGDDDLGNEWTITTVGTTSFTSNTGYYQVGSSSKPATSITFTTTLPSSVNITSMSAKFGGFSGTAGTITLKVGDTTIGTGSLNATNDVVVSSTSTASGTVLTVTVTGISKGVKAYYISYTYN